MALSDGDLERLRATVAGSTFVDRYAVGREAGAGGMGRVFDATERATGRRVAIKVLTGPRHDARFEAEVEILERLSHPAIVAYVGHGVTATGEPYLAMAWLDGETVATRLAQGRLTVADTVAIGARVVQALVYAHGQGVVHRDIKPSNVFLVDGRPDQATLIDFGVAKDQAVDRDLTHTGEVLGTPGYMAPEQVMGKTDVDGRADLFALGCLLHECLAGRPPFDGTEVMVVLARLLLHDPPRLATIRADVPARLDALVAALLAKQPEQRLADPGLVAAELDAIAVALAAGDHAALAATPIAVPEASIHDAATVLARFGPPAPRRSRRVWLLVAALAVVAGVAIAVAVAMGRGGATATVHAPGATCTNRDSSGCAALCDAGHLEACNTLGSAMLYGRRGRPVDVAGGRAMLDRACRRGDGGSCVSLAQYVRMRIAQHPGDGQAADWIALLDRGCTNRFASACELLASTYDGTFPAADGSGPEPVARDPTRATVLYEQACSLDDKVACVRLATRLRTGTGTAADPARGDAILRDICARGFSPACTAFAGSDAAP